MTTKCFLSALLVVISGLCLSQEGSPLAVDEDVKRLVTSFCERPYEKPEYGFFPETFKQAESVWKKYCSFGFASVEDQIAAIVSVLDAGQKEFVGEPGGELKVTLTPGFPALKGEVFSQSSAAAGVPNIGKLTPSPSDPRNGFTLGDPAFIVDDNLVCRRKAQTVDTDANCEDYVDEFLQVFNIAQNTLAGPLAGLAALQLESLAQEWETFAETARSQTLPEHWINGMLFQKKNDAAGFKSPPAQQLIILHPSIAIESVGDSPDGEQVNEAVLVEIVGVNWWKQDKWYIPSGGSIISLYSDRAEIQDWGYGAAVHFKNDFTIGYSNHDGEHGVFISADLWQLIQNKRSVIESYRGSLIPHSE